MIFLVSPNSMIVEPKDLKAALPTKARLMGLDLGEKTIGLALSDTRLMIASPYETIKRTKFTADAHLLLKKARHEGAYGFVLGLPLNMDGTEGPRCQSVKQFARNLAELTELPITYQDERMSTMAVTKVLIEADRSRARRKDLVDKMAASYILQGALDWLKNH
ncbi:MAG: Holliday junction resolvase RuvX [Alphaproteobacteria bacterium]